MVDIVLDAQGRVRNRRSEPGRTALSREKVDDGGEGDAEPAASMARPCVRRYFSVAGRWCWSLVSPLLRVVGCWRRLAFGGFVLGGTDLG